MKKDHAISSHLGITQHELAMLLGVSRSQCAMFELGKRDLPLHAKQFLAEMLAYVQAPENAAKTIQTAPPKAAMQQFERLLRENEYQQLLAARKMAAAAKKQEAQSRLMKLAAFLSISKNSKQAMLGLAEGVVRKATNMNESSASEELTTQQHKYELLGLEKLLLESRLRKLRLGS